MKASVYSKAEDPGFIDERLVIYIYIHTYICIYIRTSYVVLITWNKLGKKEVGQF